MKTLQRSYRIVLFMTGILILPLLVSIDTIYTQSLDYDQRCFTREECIQSRSSILRSDQDVAAGFIQNELSTQNCGPLLQQSPGSEVGFCLAGGAIETGVRIGGKNDFDNIGDFIVTVFRFSFIAAIAFAVVMILLSGIQWMASAGNSSIIGDSKKRIGGALLGLLLLSLSYTILDTINPRLTELRQPSVYMLRADVLEPIVSEQLCDPDGDGPFGSCPDNQYCLKTAGMSLEESLDGACDKLAIGAVLAPILAVGGATILPQAGPAVLGALNAGKGAVVSYVPIMNGAPLTLGSVATFGMAGAKLTGYTITRAAGAALTYELVSLADQVSGFSSDARLAYAQFTQARGICVDKSPNSLRAGDMCSTDPNAPVTCANGLNCIADDTINSLVGCWSPGTTIGFCSSGGRGSRCIDNSSCNEGFICTEFDLPGTIRDGKYCTDGGEGAYCIEDDTTVRSNGSTSDCASGYTCVGNLCTAFAATEEFDICTSDDSCENIGGNYKCYTLAQDCTIRSNGSNTLGNGPKGMCLNENGWRNGRDIYVDTSGVQHWRYPTRLQGGAGGTPMVEDGRGPTTYSLVWLLLDELHERGESWTIDLNACASTHTGGSALMSNLRHAIATYQVTRNNHTIIYNGTPYAP